MRNELWAACALVAFLAPTACAAPTLRPVDEAARNPSFLAFRTSLRDIIARKDADALLAVVDSSIKIGFGGDDGIAAFEKQWELRSSSSPLWDELGTTLALGGTFDGTGNFVAPYVFSRWPESIDAFEHVAITGTGVRVRAEPSPNGAIVGRLSHAIVPRARTPSDSEEWTAIRRSNGRTAYVATRYARSPVGYRAFFEPRGDTWKLTLFVAGD